VRSAEVGIRELQRNLSAVLEDVATEGTRLLVSRHGRPLAVMVPIDDAYAWALRNRPLGDDLADDEAFWPIEEGVRVAPSAEAPLHALPEPIQRPLLTRVRRLRGFEATGRVAIRVGQLFALVDLAGARTPTILDVARRADLRRWFHSPRGGVGGGAGAGPGAG
jgi:prevent-host-death family protein